jgi:hypothetical protein
VVSRLKRAVFAAGGRKFDLLPYEVTENNHSQQVASKQPLKGPCCISWLLTWQALVHPSVSTLKRAMYIREPRPYGMGAQDAFFPGRTFFASRICIANALRPTTLIQRTTICATLRAIAGFALVGSSRFQAAIKDENEQCVRIRVRTGVHFLVWQLLFDLPSPNVAVSHLQRRRRRGTYSLVSYLRRTFICGGVDRNKTAQQGHGRSLTMTDRLETKL